jgi:hypothetical protein
MGPAYATVFKIIGPKASFLSLSFRKAAAAT